MAEPARRARRARRPRNGGYDTALRIATEPLSDNLKCNICMGILRDPVTVNASNCGHTYCRHCINEHVRRRRTCPDCRAPIAQDGIMKVPMFQRLVNEIKVRCGTAYCEQNEFPNENACGWEGDLGDFDAHVDNSCKFGEVECPQRCGDIMERLLVDDHKAHDCKETEIPCKFPGCKVRMKRGKEDVHVAESSPAHLSAMLPIFMQLKAEVTALKSTMVTMVNARQLLSNVDVSRSFKFKSADHGTVGDNGKSLSITNLPNLFHGGGGRRLRVDIEGPMSGMRFLELTVSKAAKKLYHIKFYCDEVNQDLTVLDVNVGEKVRFGLLENGVLAAAFLQGSREPVVMPGWPTNKPMSKHIEFVFYVSGEYTFTLA